MMFSKILIDKILKGEKTSTIRERPLYKEGDITNLMANRNYSKVSGKYLKITKVYSIVLKDITDNLAKKDGFRDLEDLKTFWIKELKAQWIPTQVVYVHEFELKKKSP